MTDACPERDSKPKSKWFMYRAMAAHQTQGQQDNPPNQNENGGNNQNNSNENQRSNDSGNNSSDPNQWNNETRGVNGMQILFCGFSGSSNEMHSLHQDIDYYNDALLDTGTSFSSFVNKRLLDNVGETGHSLSMNTNAGSKVLNEQEILNGMKAPAWYNKTGITNIMSFANLADQYHITYDNRNMMHLMFKNGMIRKRKH